MKTEKIIRSQAKESLTGNWSVAVAGLFAVLAYAFLGFFIYSAFINFSNVFTSDGEIRNGSQPVVIVILCSVFIIMFLLSPFKNGFQRLCYNIADEKDGDFRDVFYFFSGTKEYFSALLINVYAAFKKMLYILIGFIPYFILSFIEIMISKQVSDAYYLETLFLIVTILSVIAGSVFALIFSLKPVICEYVFAGNPDEKVFEIAKRISRRHFKDYLKLCITFIPWILLCFFVIPIFFVIPYFFTSIAKSTRWLFKLYKEGNTV